MARRDDDRIVGRVVVDGIDVRPVPAFARAHDVAELVARFELCKILGGKSLAGLRCVDVEANRPLVEHLHDVVAVRVEDFPETPFVNNLAVLIKLGNHVAHGMNALSVRTAMIGARDADEGMSVLSIVERVGEVGVADRQAVVVDFAAHKVVLHVALAVAPGDVPVDILLEAHHDAGLINRLNVVDGFNVHVPADFALGVDDGVLRVEVPFHRAAHRIVPDRARRLGVLLHEIVDEVEAVLELRINLDHLRFEHVAMQSRRAAHLVVHGSRVDLVGVGELLRFAVELPGVGNFNRIHVVRIKTEDGNAGMRQKFGASHRILDLLTIRLRNNAHGRFRELIAAVADDGGQRRNAVRVHDINKGI